MAELLSDQQRALAGIFQLKTFIIQRAAVSLSKTPDLSQLPDAADPDLRVERELFLYKCN